MKMIKNLLMPIASLLLVSSTTGYQLKNGGKLWAVLVAGSSGYENYRHQADICHAYQILHTHGVPDENIIVMMFDDIANNDLNPTKGIIINRPNGTDVYHGVLKDYIQEDVTPVNFLNVLTGHEEKMKEIGSGRVLKSGPNDHVFVYFADHGAHAMLGFPYDMLYADQLRNAFYEMKDKKMFSRLVVYVEACEAGSMFENLLPDDWEVFAVTAANPQESSYSCYYDPYREAFLGDVFSVSWMEDSDKENLRKETLHRQFEIVRKKTNTSHVQEYGELSVDSMHVSEFLGNKTPRKSSSFEKEEIFPVDDAVPSYEVPVAILERKLEATDDPEERKELQFKLHRLLKYRHHLENTVKHILMVATGKDEHKVEELRTGRHQLLLHEYDCYKKLVTEFSQKCYKLSENPHAFRQLYMLANACGHKKVKEDSVLDAMNQVCSRPTLPRMTGIV